MKRSLSPSRGYGLVELLLVLGICAAGMASVYGIYRVVAGGHKQDVTVQWAQATIVKVTEAFSSLPNYRELTQDRAIAEGLFGKEAQIEQGRVIGPWGGEARLISKPAEVHGQIVEDAAFSLEMLNIPSEQCAPLVSSLASSNFDLMVNEQSVGTGKNLDVALTGHLCSRPRSTVSITQVRSDASTGLRLCTQPTEPQYRTVTCGAGMAGERQEERTGWCAGTYGEPTWSPWAVVEDNCQPCPGPETQFAACPPGEFGQVYQRRSFDCPANKWGNWETTSSNCQPCHEDEYRVVGCPSGAAGQIKERRVFYCNNQTWSGWQPVENTCL